MKTAKKTVKSKEVKEKKMPIRHRDIGKDKDNSRTASINMSLKSLIKTNRLRRKLVPLFKENGVATSKDIITFSKHLELEVLDQQGDPEFFADTISTSNNFRKYYTAFKRTDNELAQRLIKRENTRAIMDQALIQLHTNITTNITTHIRKRFFRYVEFIDGLSRVEAKLYVDACLDKKDQHFVEDRWGNDLKKIHAGTATTFIPMMIEWNDQIRFKQQRLRRLGEICPKGLTQFAFIPSKKVFRNMCSYDFSAMWQLWRQHTIKEGLLRGVKLPFEPQPISDVAASKGLFTRCFDFGEIERFNDDGTPTVKFGLNIKTDGIKVSVMVSKPKVTKVSLIKLTFFIKLIIFFFLFHRNILNSNEHQSGLASIPDTRSSKASTLTSLTTAPAPTFF